MITLRVGVALVFPHGGDGGVPFEKCPHPDSHPVLLLPLFHLLLVDVVGDVVYVMGVEFGVDVVAFLRNFW